VSGLGNPGNGRVADAIREVRKYHTADLSMEVTMHTANSDAVIHMRLFRAQRNLYISGFALFLWL
jgi:B-cell receptor-associated protein 31